MSSKQDNWNEEWQGLEPEQPQSGRCGCWLGALILLAALMATCIGTGYFAWQQLDLPISAESALARSTIPPFATAAPVDVPLDGTPATEEAPTAAALAATVTLPGTTDAIETTDDRDIEARFLNTVPSIDGDLDEWADIPAYQSSYLVFSAEDWDGSDDVLADWNLGWDADNLYVAVRVRDDLHVQTERGNTVFRGDGVSLQIDTEWAADLGPELSPDDYQINLSPGNFVSNPVDAYRFRGTSEGNLTDYPGHRIRIAADQFVDGYALEAAIPWADLGVSPQSGLRLGIALNVNDNDSPGEGVQEVMKSHVATRRYDDPTSWGTIVLTQ